MALPADLSLESINKSFNQPAASPIGRRVIFPLPKNPADKATVVSVFPKEIDEVKPTIFPRRFIIPAAEKDDFSLLVLNGASYYTPSLVDKQPAREIQINAAELARSICDDYLNSTWLASRNSRCPGVFWIVGEWDKKSIHKYVEAGTLRTFDQLLEHYRNIQKAWFTEVMNAADAFWASTNGNPKSIPEDARIAATLLGLENTKPWMTNVVQSELENCPSCGEMINMVYPVCRYCHAVIDPAKAKELNLSFTNAPVVAK